MTSFYFAAYSEGGGGVSREVCLHQTLYSFFSFYVAVPVSLLFTSRGAKANGKIISFPRHPPVFLLFLFYFLPNF